MKGLQYHLLAVLASVLAVSCNPLPKEEGISVYRRSDASSSTKIIEDCNKSRNCEVYEDPVWGITTRFKKNMGPGSDWYKHNVANVTRYSNSTVHGHTARAGTPTHPLAARGTPVEPHANMLIGRNHINYGTINPWDVLNHLYDICIDVSCYNDQVWVGSQAVGDFVQTPYSGTQPKWFSMILTANAELDGYDMRNRFIEAIKMLSVQKQEWTQKHWVYRFYNGWTGSYEIANQGDIWECMQADYYYVAQYGWNHDYQGKMEAHLNSDFQPASGYSCSTVKDYITSVMSLWGPIFGLAAGFIFADC